MDPRHPIEPAITSAPRVLVVDDDVVSVGQTLRWLRASGYLGAGAVSAERAQALLRDATFDLMLVKTRLPFVGGVRLMQLACAERPELRVLLVGERPNARLEMEARRCGGQYVLEPNSRKALTEAIASMLPDARPLQRWPRKRLSRRFPVRVRDGLGMLVDVSYGGFCVEMPAGEGAPPESFDVAVDAFDLQIHAKVQSRTNCPSDLHRRIPRSHNVSSTSAHTVVSRPNRQRACAAVS